VQDGPTVLTQVSIHAPARGATPDPTMTTSTFAGFNPRSREGSDCSGVNTTPDSPQVSIHAPARGATPFQPATEVCDCGFNPRSREGSDRRFAFTLGTALRVSIHAPARGATPEALQHGLKSRSFNPRSREGSDPGNDGAGAKVSVFQSTLPRGERPQAAIKRVHGHLVSIHAPARGATLSGPTGGAILLSFNPRSREGSDPALPQPSPPSRMVSIHAPARGATPCGGDGAGHVGRFNPRSREGSDLGQSSGIRPTGQFQSTLPRGERRTGPDQLTGCTRVSIHAPARGATVTVYLTGSLYVPFQSTLPRGERPSWACPGSR